MVYNNIDFAHESGILVGILELQIARLYLVSAWVA